MWKTLPLLLGFAACHAGMDDMGSMQSYVADMRRETNHHFEAARAATTLADMRGEMSRHRDGMATMMADVDMTLGSMTTRCGGSGFDELRAMHGELDGEWGRHLAAMDASNELSIAVAEVERHTAAMLATMDDMDAAMGAMTCR